MELPLDEAPGGSFDAGVGNRHHEFIELIGGQCRHVFLLWFFEDRTNSAQGVGMNESVVHPVSHDFVEALGQALDRLQAAFGLKWLKQLDDLGSADFGNWGRV